MPGDASEGALRPEDNPTLAACAFSDSDLRRLHLALVKVNGLVVCSGPADSGKRTTLYACAHHLNDPQRKLVTVEQQLRGEIALATRLHVPEAERETLGPLLMGSAMRAEADVIMVEDPTPGTVFPLALRAALTRQLVLTRLRAADAADAYQWIADHNPLPFHVTDVIRMVIYQRLLPRLCLHCRRQRPATADDETWLQAVAALHDLPRSDLPTTFYTAEGCEHCADTGTRGRQLIAELLPRSEPLVNAIRDQLPFARLRGFAISHGLTRHLALDGVHKAAAGAITLHALRQALADDPWLQP